MKHGPTLLGAPVLLIPAANPKASTSAVTHYMGSFILPEKVGRQGLSSSA